MFDWFKGFGNPMESVSGYAYAGLDSAKAMAQGLPSQEEITTKVYYAIDAVKSINIESSLEEYGIDRKEAIQVASFLEKKLIFFVIGGVCVAAVGPLAGPVVVALSKTALSSYMPEDKILISEITSYMMNPAEQNATPEKTTVKAEEVVYKPCSQQAKDKAFKLAVFIEKKLVPQVAEHIFSEYLGAPETAVKVSKLIVEYVNSKKFMAQLENYYESKGETPIQDAVIDSGVLETSIELVSKYHKDSDVDA